MKSKSTIAGAHIGYALLTRNLHPAVFLEFMMAIEQKSSEGPPIDAPTLTSAALYLLSAYAVSGCPRLAILIKRHLQLLAVHPSVDPLLRSTSMQLIDKYWAHAANMATESLRASHSAAGDHSYH